MMDWDHRRCWVAAATPARTMQSGSKKTLILPASITYAILLCLVPLVVCREVNARIEDIDVVPFGPRGYLDVIPNQEPHHHLLHHRKHNRIDAEDTSNSVKEWGLGRRRFLRGPSKPAEQDQIPDGNGHDEILDKHVSQSSSPSAASSAPPSKRANIINANLKYLEPDKKYFDYFPIEDVELSYDPKEDDIRVVLISGDDNDEDVKRKKSKKFGVDSTVTKKLLTHSRRKRDASLPGYEQDAASDVVSEGTGKSKRNTFAGPPYAYLNNFIQSQRGNYIPPSQFGYSAPPYSYSYEPNHYVSQGTPNDWNNQFFGKPPNYYLPVPLPSYTPSAPVTKYPFPDIYQNPQTYIPPHQFLPTPPQMQPQNPQNRPEQKPQPPTNVNGTRVDFSDRFGANDDNVVWDTSPLNGRDQNVGSNSVDQPLPPAFGFLESIETPEKVPSRIQTPDDPNIAAQGVTQRPASVSTRRPPPPLIHRPDTSAFPEPIESLEKVPSRIQTPDDPTIASQGVTQRPASVSTRRPPPPLIHRPDTPTESRSSTPQPSGKGKFGKSETLSPERFRNEKRMKQLVQEIFAPPATNALGNGGIDGNFRPQPSRPNQRPPPAPPAGTPPGYNGPPKCVLGAISCCARRNSAIRYACFEQLGCHGAFWDRNPCSDEFQDAALEEVSRFFD